MGDRPRRARSIWPDGRPLIGMVHLLPLPGAPEWGGSMADVVARAMSDARVLEQAGFDGLIVENFLDAPFHADDVPAETIASQAVASRAVAAHVELPVGVNVLRNDARAALAIAIAGGARFIRVNVHTGTMFTDQGIIEGRSAETVRRRATLAPDVAVLADVHVKHATPPPGCTLAGAARDAWHRGHADALIVSGAETRLATQLDDVLAVKAAVPDAVVLVGSGLTVENARELLAHADGAIVGSAVMQDGAPGGPIDPDRANRLVEAARKG